MPTIKNISAKIKYGKVWKKIDDLWWEGKDLHIVVKDSHVVYHNAYFSDYQRNIEKDNVFAVYQEDGGMKLPTCVVTEKPLPGHYSIEIQDGDITRKIGECTDVIESKYATMVINKKGLDRIKIQETHGDLTKAFNLNITKAKLYDVRK